MNKQRLGLTGRIGNEEALRTPYIIAHVRLESRLLEHGEAFGHPGDGYGGRTPTIYYQRPVSKNDIGIAHRRFPIGSLVKVTNVRTGKSAKARVIDRGPYGKLDSSFNHYVPD